MTAMAVSRSALLLLPLLQTTAIAMSAVSWIEKVQGETVVLGCTWTGDPTDTEVLDVEWFLQMPTTNIYVATFAGGEGHIYPDFASCVRFARNVTRRDASLQIAGLRASDAGVYTCKVKFGTFIKQETIRLTVLGDCEVSTWGPWSTCEREGRMCSFMWGAQERRRSVKKSAPTAPHGQRCPPLRQARRCRVQPRFAPGMSWVC
ncbi:coxsackievirus and adenovirus receptor homolog [Petromyzon marinus]|uniref:coxsackievirus and adenovirus receptor homolog n=1 Tax=Petromyzon marinus TaxID=7757 RepID=UPI003F6F8575